MRLNRVLLLAAVISMAMIAMVFTISCSDGADGNPGGPCIATLNADGKYDVSCGGITVGQLYTPNGAQGPQGPQGAPGVDCELVKVDVVYQVICGGVIRGLLEGCHTEEYGFGTLVTCLGSSGIGLCPMKPVGWTAGDPLDSLVIFDPSKQQCTESSGTGSIEDATNFCGPALIGFNPDNRYCGFLNEEAFLAGTPTVQPLCGTGSTNKPNGAKMDSDSTWVLESGDEWKDEYCKVTRTAADVAAGTFTETKAVATSDSCGGVLVRTNQNIWKGEYCGWASATAVNRTVVSNACGDGGFPDSLDFGRKYCQMTKKTDKLTTTVGPDDADFCLVGEEKVRTPINRADKYTLLRAADDWKDEYCGYESKAADTSDIASVLTGNCDSSPTSNLGPNNITDRWNNDYCQGDTTRVNGRLVAASTTTKVGGIEAYCVKPGDNALETALPTARLNEKTWQKQYCGYATAAAAATAAADSEKWTKSRLTGICDDYKAPNEESWEAGYCQVTPANRTTGRTSLAKWAANDDEAYCGADSLGAADASKTINKDKWNKEYCGYANRADAYKVTTTGPSSARVSAWTPIKSRITNDFCDYGTDGTVNSDLYKHAPNSVAATRASGDTLVIWGNQYCQFQSNGTTKLVSPGDSIGLAALKVLCVSDTGAGDSDSTKWGKSYPIDSDKLPLTGSSINNRVPKKYTATNFLNKAKWEGEYCSYAKAADTSENSTRGKFTIAKGGICGDSKKPNEVKASAGPKWLNEYCQAKGPDDPITELVGTVKTNGTQEDSTKYCGPTGGANEKTFVTAPAANRLNEKTWKGEYCFTAVNATQTSPKKGLCLAGWVPIGYNADATPPILWGTGVAPTGSKNDSCKIPGNPDP